MQSSDVYSHPGVLLLQHIQSMLEYNNAMLVLYKNPLYSLMEAVIRLHDNGKDNPLFQARIRKIMNGETPTRHNLDQHSRIGTLRAAEFFFNEPHQNDYEIIGILQLILGHHSGLEYKPNHAVRDILKYYERCQQESRTNSDLKLPPIEIIKQLEERANEVQGKFRNDSDIELFRKKIQLQQVFSRLVDVDRLSAEHKGQFNSEDVKHSGHGTQIETRRNTLINKSDPGNSLGGVRENVAKELNGHQARPEAGIYSVGIPTGTGKTLVAFQLAEWWGEKTIYLAPFMSLVDQAEKVLSDANVSTESITTDYHLSIPEPEEDKEYDGTSVWTDMERWHGLYVLSTTVRFFNDLFSMEPTALRKYHNTYGATIILDEPQSIPVEKWLGLIELLPIWVELYQWRVILLSATLPKRPKGENPIVTTQLRPLTRTKITLKLINESKDEVLLWTMAAKDLTGEAKAALWILNTVKRAQEAHRQAVALYARTDRKIQFISGELCPLHRAILYNRINEYIEKKIPFLLVSTPAIEAGVDYDFQSIVRDIAPMPNCVQAAGRLNRKGEITKPQTLWVMDVPDLSYPYDGMDIVITRNILADESDGTITESKYSAAVERYYKDALKDPLKNGKDVLARFKDNEPLQMIPDDASRERVIIAALPLLYERIELEKGWKKLAGNYPYHTAETLWEKWKDTENILDVNLKREQKKILSRLLGLYVSNIRSKRKRPNNNNRFKIISVGYGVRGMDESVVDIW